MNKIKFNANSLRNTNVIEFPPTKLLPEDLARVLDVTSYQIELELSDMLDEFFKDCLKES
jgi:hypothetical protein